MRYYWHTFAYTVRKVWCKLRGIELCPQCEIGHSAYIGTGTLTSPLCVDCWREIVGL